MSGPGHSPDTLYHLATEAEWYAYRQTGAIAPPSLETEGFVHCSWGRQVAGTIDKHYAGIVGLLALTLDPDLLGDVSLMEEDLYGSGQSFPHVYGPVPVSAVVDTVLIS